MAKPEEYRGRLAQVRAHRPREPALAEGKERLCQTSSNVCAIKGTLMKTNLSECTETLPAQYNSNSSRSLTTLLLALR